jgi:uncharacterized membrane protein YfcA
MEFVVVPIVSAVVAGLTLVSGFGLGTLLMPAFAVFFPLEIAIAATGVVHLANNVFKLALVAKWADWGVAMRFGVPAVIAAFAGGALMAVLAVGSPLLVYEVGPLEARITWLKLVIAMLLMLFAGLELWPWYQKLEMPRRLLPLGGALSGFFGGVSGMQGALRAPFLMRSGLTKEGYVGTANVVSTGVDVARLAVYAAGFAWLAQRRDYSLLTDGRTLALVAAACAAGIVGSVVGLKLVKKVTLAWVRVVVAVLLFVTAGALGAGLV